MTMVSYPAAIPFASAAAAPSPSSYPSKAASSAATPEPVAMKQVDPTPPALDCSILTAPSATINHLCGARLRLMSSLPSVGIAWSLWCGSCGALREGLSGAESPAPSLKKRTVDGAVKEDDGNTHESFADELERELEKTLAAMEETLEASPPARKPQRRLKSPTCKICGARFRRTAPRPPAYPPARTVARTRRRASALAISVKPEPEPERALSPAGTMDVAELFGEEPSTDSATPAGQSTSVTPSNALSRSPSLAHISSSDPATPTYPKPINAPPPQSGGATVPVKLPTSPPPAKKRKTKKSGLAKLLAQNAQRESEKSGGTWGLG